MVSIYFLDANLTSAFVARWCAGYNVETAEGALGCEPMSRLREPRRVYIGRRDGAVTWIDPGTRWPKRISPFDQRRRLEFLEVKFLGQLGSNLTRILSAVPSASDLGKRLSHSAQNSGLSRLLHSQAR